ncbi:MAG: hypothetical protein V8Q84_11575 [Bilophila sp.]
MSSACAALKSRWPTTATLTNAAQLRGELEDAGAIFQTSSDSEIFVHLIAHSLAEHKTLEDAVVAACDGCAARIP